MRGFIPQRGYQGRMSFMGGDTKAWSEFVVGAGFSLAWTRVPWPGVRGCLGRIEFMACAGLKFMDRGKDVGVLVPWPRCQEIMSFRVLCFFCGCVPGPRGKISWCLDSPGGNLERYLAHLLGWGQLLGRVGSFRCQAWFDVGGRAMSVHFSIL